MVDAREYHEETNHTPERIRRMSFQLDRSNKPRPYKSYEGLPRVAPDGEPDPPDAPALLAVGTEEPTPPDSVGEGAETARNPNLHALCHYAAGVTKELEVRGQRTPFRAAACTGKLYHVDLYLVAGDCGPDGPGVYHFDPNSGEFDVLRDGDYRGVLATATGDYPAVADAPVTVVATSEWWRNSWKYRDRTYRHAFWDSGTILANLLAVAHGSGQRAEVVTGFADEAVTKLLGLDPDDEAPLELVAVGSGDPIPDASGSDGESGAVTDPAELTTIDPAEAPLSDDPIDYPLVSDAWRRSALADGDSATEWREKFATEVADAAAFASRPETGGERIELDPVGDETASARPVGTTIERRGSCREYSHDPISARKFATVLDRALGGTPVDAFTGHDLRGLVDYYCLVLGVDGIERGAYEYHPGTNELERVGDIDRDRAGHLALGQDVVGDAAANVYAMADVDAIAERFGDRGYRVAQLEGGIALGRLYLATYAHRTLGGRGFTFFDDLVAEQFAPHADGQTPMTLFAFGRPA